MLYLINRAELAGDEEIGKTHLALVNELKSEVYKEKLRQEILKNVEKGI